MLIMLELGVIVALYHFEQYTILTWAMYILLGIRCLSILVVSLARPVESLNAQQVMNQAGWLMLYCLAMGFMSYRMLEAIPPYLSLAMPVSLWLLYQIVLYKVDKAYRAGLEARKEEFADRLDELNSGNGNGS